MNKFLIPVLAVLLFTSLASCATAPQGASAPDPIVLADGQITVTRFPNAMLPKGKEADFQLKLALPPNTTYRVWVWPAQQGIAAGAGISYYYMPSPHVQPTWTLIRGGGLYDTKNRQVSRQPGAANRWHVEVMTVGPGDKNEAFLSDEFDYTVEWQ